ncbi:peptidoglycan-binding domain-containing protein, partial [Streptomyces erythrogriseus]|uniref:peptidoglycan-binding domain-containing protein n=1 Tax=Streptomyces erythrogriseus TaxID=284027 RepID=UPI0031F7384C
AGFGGALLFTERPADDRATVPASPPAAAAPPPPRTASPVEDGFLREGDAGPDVAALQERLLRVPDVYRDGRTDGRYDATLREAVARFQLWYGIRGDETGVYGDDTRRALESHTGGPAGDDAA